MVLGLGLGGCGDGILLLAFFQALAKEGRNLTHGICEVEKVGMGYGLCWRKFLCRVMPETQKIYSRLMALHLILCYGETVSKADWPGVALFPKLCAT